MGVIKRILAKQLEMGVFANEEQKVSGIAQLALDKGFDNLSELQKRVLQPFLTQPCSGHINPGGHHNECEATLESEELLEAYEEADDPEFLQCERCRTEAEHEAYDRARFFEED
jgi:hypothetical protein